MKLLIVLPFLFTIFGFGFMSHAPFSYSFIETRSYGKEILPYITEFEKENDVTVSHLSIRFNDSLSSISDTVVATCSFGKKTPSIEIYRKHWVGLTLPQKKALMNEHLGCAVFKKPLKHQWLAKK